MYNKFLYLFFALPMALLFASCAIEDDIPYPYVESAITAIQVEGQCNETGTGTGSAVINNDAHTVMLYVNDGVDVSRLSISRLEVSNDATISVDKSVCINPNGFPAKSFKEIANADDSRINFTAPVKFTLTTYQDYEWTIRVQQVLRSEIEVFARCTDATLRGTTSNGVAPGIEVREQGTESWNAIPATQIQVLGAEFVAEVTGLAPGKTYEYRTKVGTTGASGISTFTTAPALQLPNSSFDEWSSSGSGIKTLYMPWAEGAEAFWDTGNRGATTVGASNSTGLTEGERTFANLQSKYIVVKFAAGNIFAGQYLATDGTNGILSFGREFTSFPTKMKFDYKFTTSPINRVATWNNAYSEYVDKDMFTNLKDKPDSCQIYVALLDDYLDDADREANTYDGKVYPWIIRTSPKNLHLFKPMSPRVIAYGQMTQGSNVEDWTTEEIVLNYRYTDRKPKYIMVVASSSKYGDYFTGGDKTLLQLDNIRLEY